MFRLVTDETVEVKVVERAQQKLKLDAMVVQQGQLQDKEKKLSKQDLLDTLRFGADKVFRSKESTITDADIDLILAEGAKRTKEMNDKLQENQKGDMYDFKLDGATSTQVFEGKDYSDKTTRENKASDQGLQFLDLGKRERKAVKYTSGLPPKKQEDDVSRFACYHNLSSFPNPNPMNRSRRMTEVLRWSLKNLQRGRRRPPPGNGRNRRGRKTTPLIVDCIPERYRISPTF